MSLVSEGGIIHADDSYASHYTANFTNNYTTSGMVNLIDLHNRWLYARKEEQKFYEAIFPQENVTDIKVFLSKVKEELNKFNADLVLFKRLSHKNLKGLSLDELDSEKEVFYITVTGDCKEISLQGLETEFIKIEGKKELVITLTPNNTRKIKEALNKQYKKGQFKYREDESESKALNELLHRYANSGQAVYDLFTVQSVKVKQTPVTSFVMEDVFSASKSDLLNKNSKGKTKVLNKKEAKRIRKKALHNKKKIEQFIFSGISSASPQAQAAFKEAWNELENSSEQRYFFFRVGLEGGLGALGEFANMAFTIYLSKLRGKNKVISKIVGDNRKLDEVKNQEPRSDVQLIIELGGEKSVINFQTKNIDTETTVTTSTTPYLIEPNFGSDLTNYLVEYAANATFASNNNLNDVKKLFAERYYEAMNFNVNKELDKNNANTFYVFGGTQLVPVSDLIMSLIPKVTPKKSIEKIRKFEISSGRVKSYTTGQYVTSAGGGKAYGSHSGGLGIWKKENGSWVDTDENTERFKSYSKLISITTSFSVSSLLSSGMYEFLNV